MRIRLLLPLLALLAAVPAWAQPAHTYRSEWHRFSMQVPASWRRMPDHALRAYEEDASARVGVPLTYEAGFRVGAGGDWRTPPVALLQVVPTTRRMTQADFEAEFTTGQAYQEMLAAAQIAELSGARIEAPVWDDENRLAWIRTFFGSGEDRLYGFTAVALNPAGTSMLWLNYYSKRADDVATARAQLLSVMRSLRFDSGTRRD
jgi:hypothetical protein